MSDHPIPEPAESKQEYSMWSALGLVGELGYIIAIPAVLGGFGGAYLDKYFDTSPLFTLLGLLLALIISGYAVYRRVKNVSSRF